jgi:hypothetical protein
MQHPTQQAKAPTASAGIRCPGSAITADQPIKTIKTEGQNSATNAAECGSVRQICIAAECGAELSGLKNDSAMIGLRASHSESGVYCIFT